MSSHFRRKPEVIRFNGQLINFAALCPNQVNESDIEYENKRLFELFNPENKYQLSMGFNLFNMYSKVFKKYSFKLFNLENLRSLFIRFSNSPNKTTIINEILSEDCADVNGTRNDIRTAFINDLKCKASVVFTDNTVNCIDFCFDTLKDYSENKIEGIQISENGFLNPSKFTVTIFINKKYLVDWLNYTDETEGYFQDIRLSLFAAVFKDGYRIAMTEKLMILLNLLGYSDFTFLNTSSSQYIEYNNERFENISKEFYDTYKDIITLLNKDEDFNRLISALRSVSTNINPLNVLSLIEPSDKLVGSLLKIEFRDPEEKINKFISSFKLYETDEDKTVDDIKKTILAARILPLLQFTTYYLQNSSNYKTYKIIDKTIEDFVHNFIGDSNSYISIYNFDALKYTHLNNDEYYDKIRDTFKNPLKNTKHVMIGFNNCIYKTSIKPEPVAVPESEGDFDDNY